MSLVAILVKTGVVNVSTILFSLSSPSSSSYLTSLHHQLLSFSLVLPKPPREPSPWPELMSLARCPLFPLVKVLLDIQTLF
jgi:hypothetical protein